MIFSLLDEFFADPPLDLARLSARWGPAEPAGTNSFRIAIQIGPVRRLTATVGPDPRIDLLEIVLDAEALRRDQLTARLGQPQPLRPDKERLLPLAYPLPGGMLFAYIRVADHTRSDAPIAKLLLRRDSYLR